MDVTELLLHSGSSVDKQNRYGWTALHQAAAAGHLRVLQILIQHGASTDILTKYGQTALSLAASAGHSDIVVCLINNSSAEELRKNEEGNSGTSLTFQMGALLVASACGHLKTLTILIENGWDVNHKHKTTLTTCLMLAAGNGSSDICQLLLERNADLNATDCAGRGAPSYAATMGKKIRMLAPGDASVRSDQFYLEESHISATDVFESLRNDELDVLSRILTASPGLKNKETLDVSFFLTDFQLLFLISITF